MPRFLDRRRLLKVRPRSGGFTLIELLVVIGIIALLMGILLPSLSAAQEQARTIKCAANLRSIGQAMNAYAAEHKGSLVPCDIPDGSKPSDPVNGVPVGETWVTILVTCGYLKIPVGVTETINGGDHVFKCPSGVLEELTGVSNIASGLPPTRLDRRGAMGARHVSVTLEPGRVIYCWYGANGTSDSQGSPQIPMQRVPVGTVKVPRKLSFIKNSGGIVLIFDGIGGVNMQSVNANRLNARHGKSDRNKQTNLLFADTHVETVFTKDLPGGVDNANQPNASTTFSPANLVNYPHPKWRLDQK
jgi:prepilin-type N-terminal cleavage/methylation domain-containing protein/prepilin-type processing-associated H-X9-DG protein